VTHPADAVVEAIDGALRDCSVSEDAMRWTPEPVPADDDVPEFNTEGLEALLAAVTCTAEELGRHLTEVIAPAFQAMSVPLGEVVARSYPALAAFRDIDRT
jgi:hypothetical protein